MNLYLVYRDLKHWHMWQVIDALLIHNKSCLINFAQLVTIVKTALRNLTYHNKIKMFLLRWEIVSYALSVFLMHGPQNSKILSKGWRNLEGIGFLLTCFRSLYITCVHFSRFMRTLQGTRTPQKHNLIALRFILRFTYDPNAIDQIPRMIDTLLMLASWWIPEQYSLFSVELSKI